MLKVPIVTKPFSLTACLAVERYFTICGSVVRKGSSVMPEVVSGCWVKLGDVADNPIDFGGFAAKSFFCFCQSLFADVKDGYVFKTFVKQVVHQFAVAPANINDVGLLVKVAVCTKSKEVLGSS